MWDTHTQTLMRLRKSGRGCDDLTCVQRRETTASEGERESVLLAEWVPWSALPLGLLSGVSVVSASSVIVRGTGTHSARGYRNRRDESFFIGGRSREIATDRSSEEY